MLQVDATLDFFIKAFIHFNEHISNNYTIPYQISIYIRHKKMKMRFIYSRRKKMKMR